MEQKKLHFQQIAPLCAAALHWLATFFLERRILTVSPSDSLFNYILCKLLLLAALVWFWRFVFRALSGQDMRARRTLLYALPYLAVLIVWLLRFHPFTLVSDELNLFTRACALDSFAYWFNYFSGFYWIIGIMLIPTMMGPVYLKLLIQALICGYCLARQSERSGKWKALPMYLLFLLPFVLNQGISAHRLPTYGMLYLFTAAKLYYDWRADARIDKKTFALLTLSLAVLAIWRSEGIYLLPLGICLLFAAYRIAITKRNILRALAAYALIFAIVAAPQLKAYYFEGNPPLSLRTKPLCGYALCNMLRNGLTEDMLAEDYDAIDAYLPLETIRRSNETVGDGNYESAQIMNEVRDGISYAQQEEFVSACKRVILRHPLIYLRAQWGAFRYLCAKYPVSLSAGPVRAVYNLSCQLWLPALLLLAFAVLDLIRRRWLPLGLCLAGLCNFGIVFLLMPAAYAKYFYATYLLGYFLLLCGGIDVLFGRKDKADAKPAE